MHVTWLSPLQVHAKAVLKDVEGAVPDEAPMMIWDDEIDLGWSEIEREGLREMGGFEARHSSEYSHSEYSHSEYTVDALTMAYYGLLWLTMAYYGLLWLTRRAACRGPRYLLPPAPPTITPGAPRRAAARGRAPAPLPDGRWRGLLATAAMGGVTR